MSLTDLDRVPAPEGVQARSSSLSGRPARPRIMILSTWHPEPADNGRKQRTRFMIEALAPGYDVVLVSLLPTEDVRGQLSAVPGVWRQFTLPIPVFRSGALADILRGASPYPRSVSATWSRSTSRSIARLVSELSIRAVFGTDLRTLRYLEAVADMAHVILDEPDVSPFVTLPGEGSIRERLRERKLRRLLQRTGPVLSSAIVASEQEASAYRSLARGGHVTIVENGVAKIPEVSWEPNSSSTLLYTGSPRYGPNAEAVEHFIRQILPLVEREVADVSLTVTGDLPEVVSDVMRRPRVHLTGRLANLERTFLESRVFIAPILSGTGTRVKLLEAMAYGMPVVSTTKGAEGLPVEHGRHLLLADDPDDFAGSIHQLLMYPDLCLSLGVAARALVADRFTWRAQEVALRTLVDRLVMDD